MPKLLVKRAIIKVTVTYTCTTKKFKCKYVKLNIPDFIGNLMNAIEQNMTVIKQCQEGGYNEDGEKLLAPLSASEINEYGANPIQLQANYGLIIEEQGDVFLRLYKHSLYNLSEVKDQCKNMPNIVQYTKFGNDTFFYEKVIHDPGGC